MQCTRVSEQLPERRNQTVSKAVRGRAGTPGEGRGGGRGAAARSAVATRGGGGVRGTRAAGYVGALAAPGPAGVRRRGGKGLAGRGCPEWGSGTPAQWATLDTPGPWAGWGAGKGGRPGREAQEGRGGSSCACRQGAGAVQRSRAGRERRVAGSAQTVLEQCGFQGAPPSSFQSQHNLRVS